MEKLFVLEGNGYSVIRDINIELTKGWSVKSITTGTSGIGTCYAYVVLQKGNNLINS